MMLQTNDVSAVSTGYDNVDLSRVLREMRGHLDQLATRALPALDASDKEALDQLQGYVDVLATMTLNDPAEKPAQQEFVARLATEMQIVSEVTEALNRLTNVQDVMQLICDLAKARFGLYHAHLYLFDEKRTSLTLVAGAGDVGRTMHERGHRIAINHPHSIVASVARTGEATIVNDVRRSPNFLPNPLLPQTRSEMAVPMRVGGTLIGVFDVQSEETNHFDEGDAPIKTSLAAQAAIALENSRQAQAQQQAESRLRRIARQLQTVAEVGSAITTILSLDTLLPTVVDLTKERFDLYHAHIYLISADDNSLILAAGAGEPGKLMQARGHSIARTANSLVATAARERRVVIVNDVTQDPNFLVNPLLPMTRAEMSLPLLVGDHLIGVLDVQSDTAGRFDQDDISVKTSLAAQIAIAIENSRAFAGAEQARRETQHIYNESLELIGTAGFDGYFRELNPSWTRMLGYTREHLLANPFIDFVHEDDKEATIAVAVELATGKPAVSFINRYRTLPGNYLWIEWNTSADLNSQTLYFVAHDISAQVELQQQREESLKAAQLQSARDRQTADRLREVDRLKSQFLANMSHELRTPLNSIIGYSEILIDGDDGDLTQEAAEDIGIIYNSGKHLLNLINEILDLAKIEAGEVNLVSEIIDLERLVADIVGSSQVLINSSAVTLSLNVEAHGLVINADPLRLRQIVTNLVSNAAKFTEEGAVVVTIARHDDYFARVSVLDSGIGINEADLTAIFERFRQVDGSSTRRAGGTGLGLSISRSLIEMLGGEIYVESTVGVGSTFWFTIPLA